MSDYLEITLIILFYFIKNSQSTEGALGALQDVSTHLLFRGSLFL